MVGCPVDSIHRWRHLQIVIEDHCIGCGLCAENCPYGIIFMVPNERKLIEAPAPAPTGRKMKIGLKSTPQPQCVASCPHDAAYRVTGPESARALTGGRG